MAVMVDTEVLASGKSRSGETLDDVPDTWKKEESTALRTTFKISPGPVLFVIISY